MVHVEIFGDGVDLDRAGIGRYAEAFDSVAQSRARFKEIKAQLGPDAPYSASAYHLAPQPGVPQPTVAVVSAGSSQPHFEPSRGGRRTTLPDALWLQLVAKAYEAELRRGVH